MPSTNLNIIFAINRGSGRKQTDYHKTIRDFLKEKPLVQYRFFEIEPGCNVSDLQQMIRDMNADIVVAVGGDGTIKFVAEQIMKTKLHLGIIPAGSANGLAKDLNIPLEPTAALEVILRNKARQIHLIDINGHVCIHLSDIGFNAYTVKVFEGQEKRGMAGYVKAAWYVLRNYQLIKASFDFDGKILTRTAVMIVLANATRYGTGVTINPEGSLEDDEFEVIIVRKISLSELFKMTFTRWQLNKNKTEILKVKQIVIRARHKNYFQVDGEYLGKTKQVAASIIPGALWLIS